MTPNLGCKKPDARRNQLSVRLDDSATALLDVQWAPDNSLASNRAEALNLFLKRWNALQDLLWSKVRPGLTVQDLLWVAKGIMETNQVEPWRGLCTAIWDPDSEPEEDEEAILVVKKVAGWDPATRLAVVMVVERAIFAASRANPEMAKLGATSNKSMNDELLRLLA